LALSQLRQLLNVVHGNITYPATMVAMALLGLGDSNITHATVVHEFDAFAQAFQRRASGAEQDAELAVQVHHVDGRVQFASRLDDYDHRPTVLEDYSPVLLSMLYQSKPFAGDTDADAQDTGPTADSFNAPQRRPRAGSYLRFHPTHPFYSSHVLCRRPHPLLPRFCGEPPVQPTDDASSDDKEAWAAYFLGNFTPHRASDHVAAPLYPAATAWIAALGVPASVPSPLGSSPEDLMGEDAASSAGLGNNNTDSSSDAMDVDTTAPAAAGAAAVQPPSWAWKDVPHIPSTDTPRLLPLGSTAARQLPAPSCPHSVAHALRALPGQLSPRHLSYLLADNIDGRTAARKEIGASVHVKRAMQRAGLAVAARLQGAQPDAPRPLDNDDDDDCSDLGVSEDPEAAEAAMAGLEASMLAAEVAADNHLRHGPLPYMPAADMPASTAPTATYQCTGAAEVRQVKDAISAATAWGKAHEAVGGSASAPAESTEFLTVSPGEGTPLQAVLYVLQQEALDTARTQQLQVIEVGSVPPFVPMDRLPTITETILLTNLNKRQALVFAYLAQRIVDRKERILPDGHKERILPAEQLLLLFLGGPGTGKTHVIKTLQWFAYQHHIHKAIAVTAYAWKAAILLQTPHTAACSTSTFFHIDSRRNNALRESKPHADYVGMRADNLDGKWLTFFDELSFIGASHLNAMSQAAMEAVGTLFNRGPAGAEPVAQQLAQGCPKPSLQTPPLPFGGLDVVGVGDLHQLPAVNAVQLYTAVNNIPPNCSRDANIDGRKVFEQFKSVMILTEQNRIAVDDADGQDLLNFVNVFCDDSADGPSLAAVAAVFDALNANTVTKEWLDQQYAASKVPKIVVLRHTVAKELNVKLAQQHCIAKNERMVVWRSVDSVSVPHTGSGAAAAIPVPPELRAIVDELPPNKTKDMLGVGYFFKGMCMRFTSSDNPGIGHMTNAECVAEALILDPDEPDDDGGPIRNLHKPPIAMCVRPLQANVADLCSSVFPECPSGCIIIPFPKSATKFQVQLRIPVQVGGTQTTSVSYHRRNFTLGVGYAFTDYFCQVRLG
jgi:hypothetical protein